MTHLAVRFSELDPYSHVNHAAYVTYFEVARTEALTDAGLPIEKVAVDGFQFVVTEIAVKYRRPAVANDRLEIDTWIVERGRASMRWSQRIRRGEEVLVTEDLRVGVTDVNGRPTKAPAWLFAIEGPLNEPPT